MRTYRVIALSVGSGKGSLIFKSGDVVKESSFKPGRAEELVLKGFLERIGEEPIEPKKTEPKAPVQNVPVLDDEGNEVQDETKNEDDDIDNVDDLSNKVLDSLNDSKQEVPDFDDITKNEIIEKLKSENVDFKQQATKEELYKKLKDLY